MQAQEGNLTYQLDQDLMINQIEPNKVIQKAHLNSIECIAGHPSNKSFATGSHDKTIKMWDLEKTKESMQLSDHKQGVWSVDFSKDGSQILSGSPDTTVILWDSKKGSIGAKLTAHKDKVYDAKFSHSNKYIASCGIGAEINIWEVANLSKPLKTIKLKESFVYHIEWALNDELIFATTWQSKLYTFDGKTFEILSIQTITDKSDSKCESCTTNFKTLPGRVFVATDRGNVSWYEYKQDSKQTIKQIEFTAHMDECRSVLLHPERKVLASTGRDGSVRLWDCDQEGHPKLLNNLTLHDQKVSGSIFLGDWVITASWDQNIGLWKIADKK